MSFARRFRREARLFLIAIEFFTRIRVPVWVWHDGWRPELLNRSSRYFPAVGGVVGLVASGVLLVALAVLPPSAAVMLSIAASLLLTGAFHEDGLADSCDGFGGGLDRAQVLAIMKNSRIGSYAAAGLWVVLTLKFTLLTDLVERLSSSAITSIVASHTISRLSALWVMLRLRYVRDEDTSKSKPIAQEISISSFMWASGLAFLLCLPLGPILAATAVVAALLFAEGAVTWLHARLGGYVGDALGAVQQLSEVLVLIVLLGAARWMSS